MAVKVTPLMAMWSELVKVAPGSVTASPAAASTKTNDANLRFEIFSCA